MEYSELLNLGITKGKGCLFHEFLEDAQKLPIPSVQESASIALVIIS